MADSDLSIFPSLRFQSYRRFFPPSLTISNHDPPRDLTHWTQLTYGAHLGYPSRPWNFVSFYRLPYRTSSPPPMHLEYNYQFHALSARSFPPISSAPIPETISHCNFRTIDRTPAWDNSLYNIARQPQIWFDIPPTRHEFTGSACTEKIIRAIAGLVHVDWNRIADFLGFVEEISLVTFKEEGELEFDLRTSGPSRVSESDNGARDWYGRRRELTRKEWEKEEAKGGYKLPKATVLTNNGNRFYWIVWALARLLAEEEIDVAHRLGLTSEIPQVHQQEDLVGNIWTLRERADQEYGGWRLREGGDHECWIVSPSS